MKTRSGTAILLLGLGLALPARADEAPQQSVQALAFVDQADRAERW